MHAFALWDLVQTGWVKLIGQIFSQASCLLGSIEIVSVLWGIFSAERSNYFSAITENLSSSGKSLLEATAEIFPETELLKTVQIAWTGPLNLIAGIQSVISISVEILKSFVNPDPCNLIATFLSLVSPR